MIRSDLFKRRKCVHVSLEKELHAALRKKLFENNLAMQDIFREFALRWVEDDSRATKIVDGLIMRKIREDIEPKAKRIPINMQRLNDMDVDAVYTLINDGDIDTDTEEEV